MKKLSKIMIVVGIASLLILAACGSNENQQTSENDLADTDISVDLSLSGSDAYDSPDDMLAENGGHYEWVGDTAADSTPIPLTISFLVHEFQILPPFIIRHEFDYSEFWRNEGSFDFDGITETLLITTDAPVRNLQVIQIENDVVNDAIVFDVVDTMFWVEDDFLPYELLLINSYFGKGTLPFSGISFLDENNMLQRFFFIQQNEKDGEFRLIEFEPNSVAPSVSALQ